MKISSTAFQNNEEIPPKYTCDGENISPQLVISEIPEQTKTLALISDDPDAPAGTWVHWIVFNIHAPEANQIEIQENANPGIKGTNDFQKLGYRGPCPPSGTHRYFFKIYALNTQLDLQEGATKQQVETAIQDHIIQQAQLVGLYSRK